MGFEKSLLGGPRVGATKLSVTRHAAHAEDLQDDALASQLPFYLIPACLPFLPQA